MTNIYQAVSNSVDVDIDIVVGEDTKFTISKLASSVAVDVDDIVVGEDAVIGVSVPGIVSGVVNVTVNGRSYNVAIVDGKGVLIISNLAAGDYAVDVIINILCGR